MYILCMHYKNVTYHLTLRVSLCDNCKHINCDAVCTYCVCIKNVTYHLALHGTLSSYWKHGRGRFSFDRNAFLDDTQSLVVALLTMVLLIVHFA